MGKRLFVIIFVVCLYHPHVYASRSILFSTSINEIHPENTLVLTASASGFGADDSIYIKGVFSKEGSTNYFGYTKNGDSWVKCGEKTILQRQVAMKSWDGTLEVKPDYADSGFNGNGTYLTKIGYYYTTSGGNISSVQWSDNTHQIIITAPTPTIQLTNSPRPTQPINTPTLPTTIPTQVENDHDDAVSVSPTHMISVKAKPRVLGNNIVSSPSAMIPTRQMTYLLASKPDIEHKDNATPSGVIRSTLYIALLAVCASLTMLGYSIVRLIKRIIPYINYDQSDGILEE